MDINLRSIHTLDNDCTHWLRLKKFSRTHTYIHTCTFNSAVWIHSYVFNCGFTSSSQKAILLILSAACAGLVDWIVFFPCSMFEICVSWFQVWVCVEHWQRIYLSYLSCVKKTYTCFFSLFFFSVDFKLKAVSQHREHKLIGCLVSYSPDDNITYFDIEVKHT